MDVIINQMIQLFLLLFLGYFLYKIKVIDNHFNGNLTRFVLNVTIPCMLIQKSLIIEEYKPIGTIGYVFFIALIVYLILPIIGYLIARLLRVPVEERGLYIFMTTYSNIGFIGFPVMNSIFGSEAIFYTTIFNMIFNLSVYTFGLYIINLGTDNKIKLSYKSLITPATIACVISLIIYLAHIKLPTVLTDTIGMVGDITTPLAMIIMGVTLASIPLKEVFTEIRIYPYTILKQVILPIIIYPVLSYFITDPLILGVTLINIAMPVGNSAVLFTNVYGGNQELAAKTIFITTIISIMTIPFIVGLLL